MNNFVYVPKNKVITLILKSEEDGLRLTYANQYYCELFSIQFPYDKNELFSKYISNEYYSCLTHICKQLETSYESYQSIFSFSHKDTIIPLYIHITSLKPKDCSIFFITANDINNDPYYDMVSTDNGAINLLTLYDCLFEKLVHAAALFNCEDPSLPKIERINAKMMELTATTSVLKESYFYESKFFNQLIQSKSIIERNITIHQKNTIHNYKIQMIPIIRNDIVLKSILLVIDHKVQNENNSSKSSLFTPRENEVIEYVLMGAKNDYIAKKLNISIGTIKRTLFNIYNKLGISSRVELINYYHSLKNDKE